MSRARLLSIFGRDKGSKLGILMLATTSVLVGMTISLLSLSLDSAILLAIGVTLVLPVIWRVAQRHFDPFEPIVFFTLAYSVMFLVRPSAMLLMGDLVYERSSRAIDVSAKFTEMLAIALIGAVSFTVAYVLPIGRGIALKLRKPPKDFYTNTAVAGAMATAFIAVISFGLLGASSVGLAKSISLVLAGRSPELTAVIRGASSYLWYGSFLLVPSALVLMVVGHSRRRIGLVIMASFVIALLILRAVPIGSRMLLLPLIGSLLAYYYVARMARPGLVTIIAFGAIALFGSTLFLNLRSAQVRRELGAREVLLQIITTPARLFHPFITGADAEMAPVLVAALQIIPEELPHTYGGAVIGDLFVRPVPRQIWSEKPLPPREKVIATLWPAEYAMGKANPEFSVLLYFYLDFGFIGVAIGMIIYGVLWRALYEYYRMNETNIVAQLLFTTSLPFVVIAVRDSPVDTLIRGIFIIFPILIIFRVASAYPIDRLRTHHLRGEL